MSINKPTFSSSIANIFGHYAERCAAEHADRTLSNDYCVLTSFDSFLNQKGFDDSSISEDLILEWINQLSTLSEGRIALYERIIGKFLRFSGAFGIKAYIPDVIKIPDDYLPYIFTQAELTSLCDAADNFKLVRTSYPWIQAEIPMLTRIFIGCGTRTTETLKLQMKNVNLDDGYFIMRDTKGEVERYVPFSSILKEILSKYCVMMGVAANPNAYLFPGKTREIPLHDTYYNYVFHKLLEKAEIDVKREKKGKRSICAYCLRHTFACYAVIYLKKQGIHVDSLYPYLSTYMGHKDLYSTEKYLKFSETMVTEELIEYESSLHDIYQCKVFRDKSEWY